VGRLAVWTLAIASMMLCLLCEIAFPWSIKLFIDDVVGKWHPQLFGIVICVMVSSAIGTAVFGMLAGRFKSQALEDEILALRIVLLNKLNHLALPITQRMMDSFRSRVTNDTRLAAEAKSSILFDAIQSIVGLLSQSAILIALAPSVFLSLVIFTPLVILPQFLRRKNIQASSLNNQIAISHVQNVSGQTVDALPLARAFSEVPWLIKRAYKTMDDSRQAALDLAWVQQTTNAVSLFLYSLPCIATYIIGGVMVLQRRMAVGTLVAYGMYAGNLLRPIQSLSYLSGRLSAARGAGQRIREFLDLREDIANSEAPVNVENCLEFERLWFSYGDVQVLSDVSGAVKKGQSVAIIGPNGSGKSTLIKVLAGIYRPQKGTIRRANGITYAGQRDILINGSIKENIEFGRGGNAELDPAVSTLLETGHALSDDATVLSGGQAKRVCLARAFYRAGDIVFLDEPNNSLDRNCEAQLRELLCSRNRPSIVCVLHDTSWLPLFDSVWEVKNGGIVEVRGVREHIR